MVKKNRNFINTVKKTQNMLLKPSIKHRYFVKN